MGDDGKWLLWFNSDSRDLRLRLKVSTVGKCLIIRGKLFHVLTKARDVIATT